MSSDFPAVRKLIPTVLLAALAACGGSSMPTSPGTGGGTGNPPPNTINVVNNSFSPSTLTVAAGTTVTWSWSSTAVDHNVVPDDGSTPTMSGAPTNGPHTYTFTFTNPGTYHFHCQVHGGAGGQGMSGTVVVQ
jgi:plastocyanin